MNQLRNREQATLILVAVAAALLPISLTGASVVSPLVSADLHAGVAAVSWIVNGYDLSFAAFLLVAGSLADRYGRRRVYRIGETLFGLGSLVAALGPDIVTVDVARFVAGAGAAAATTGASAVLAQTFVDPARRMKAFGVFGMALGLGLALGPLLSGALAQAFGWRAVFLVPAVVGLLGAALGRVITADVPERSGRLDVVGAALFSVALLLLVLGVVQGPQWGWGSGGVVGAFVGAAVLLAAFAGWERRTPAPMFDLTLLARPSYQGLSLAAVVFVVAFVPIMVWLPVFEQVGRGLGTARAGALMLFVTAPTVVVPVVTRVIARRLTTRAIVIGGLAVATAGLFLLTTMSADGPVLTLAGPLVLIGIGVGVSFTILDGAAVSSVPLPQAGIAAGMFNTVRLTGETISIAVSGSLLTALTTAGLAGRSGLADAVTAGDTRGLPAADRGDAVDALTSAWHVLALVLGAVVVISLPLLATLLREAPSPMRRVERPAGDGVTVEHGGDRGAGGDRADEVAGSAVTAADGDAPGVGAFDDTTDRPAVCGVPH